MMSMIQDVLKIIEEYGLGGVVRWILENNPAQALGYHSFNHSLWVAYYAYEAYRHDTNGKLTCPRLGGQSFPQDTDTRKGQYNAVQIIQNQRLFERIP